MYTVDDTSDSVTSETRKNVEQFFTKFGVPARNRENEAVS